MRRLKSISPILACVLLLALLASCAATQVGADHPWRGDAGFWKGLWHGFIAPVTFFVSLFSDHVRIYQVPNAGRLYDFGFMLGISGFSGGMFAGSRSAGKRKG